MSLRLRDLKFFHEYEDCYPMELQKCLRKADNLVHENPRSVVRLRYRHGIPGRAVHYLERDISEKCPTDAHRLAIKAVPEATDTRGRMDSCGEQTEGGVEELEAPEGATVEETHIPEPMDLPCLERLVGE
ncbi:uncharacterized protein LOC124160778 isoform X2 [Ischnura elegans]|uniref:uncharacterized protein LOC124160778 isoform X2 n=1 Tax=Ischnura elegans TaxID=197161 RepID=UPI001ED8AA6D|nr:uncharacterized protein LOC124160778 isoform X2 [Ischnura elegans]